METTISEVFQSHVKGLLNLGLFNDTISTEVKGTSHEFAVRKKGKRRQIQECVVRKPTGFEIT
jgi:hypothetical protein